MLMYKEYNIEILDKAHDEKTGTWYYPLWISKFAGDNLIKDNWLYLASNWPSEADFKDVVLLERLLSISENTKIRLRLDFVRL